MFFYHQSFTHSQKNPMGSV